MDRPATCPQFARSEASSRYSSSGDRWSTSCPPARSHPRLCATASMTGSTRRRVKRRQRMCKQLGASWLASPIRSLTASLKAACYGGISVRALRATFVTRYDRKCRFCISYDLHHDSDPKFIPTGEGRYLDRAEIRYPPRVTDAKHREQAYRPGPSASWVKIRTRNTPR
jgi:hypothetical protein